MKHGHRIKDKRLVFKPGYQSKFIRTVKNGVGLKWNEIANIFNVSEYTVRVAWACEKSTLPCSVAKIMLEKYPFIGFRTLLRDWILATYDPFWGQRKGKSKPIALPSKNEMLAEFVGIVLGDGSVSKREIVIAKEYPIERVYIDYIRIMIKKLFSIDSTLHQKSNTKVRYIDIHSTILVNYINQMGIKCGNKIKNKTTIPNWIFKRKLFIEACLRGLLDTDGGIYHKQKKYGRGIIEFQTKSEAVSEAIKKALRTIQFTPSKSNLNVRIQNQDEVKRFFKEIGSCNPKHIIRFQRLLDEGYIPKVSEIFKEACNYPHISEPFKATVV